MAPFSFHGMVAFRLVRDPAVMNETDFSFNIIHWSEGILGLKINLFSYLYLRNFIFFFICCANAFLFSKIKLCINMYNSTNILVFPCSTPYKLIIPGHSSFAQYSPFRVENRHTVKDKSGHF